MLVAESTAAAHAPSGIVVQILVVLPIGCRAPPSSGPWVHFGRMLDFVRRYRLARRSGDLWLIPLVRLGADLPVTVIRADELGSPRANA